MTVELKAGLWGVSRDKRVWGPFISCTMKGFPFTTEAARKTWERSGNWWSEMGEDGDDIITTFKTQEAAKAFAAEKPVKVKKPVNFQRLALRMSKAKSITEVRAMYKKAVGK